MRRLLLYVAVTSACGHAVRAPAPYPGFCSEEDTAKGIRDEVRRGTTIHRWDSNGHLLTSSDGETRTDYEYDEHGWVTRQTSNGESDTYRYDRRGNMVTEISHDGTIFTMTYDAAGHEITRRGPRFLVTTTYDAAGNETDNATFDDGELDREVRTSYYDKDRIK